MTQHRAFQIEQDPVGRTATLRLARPDDGNRLNLREILSLGQAVREAGSRPEMNIVVIRAKGPDFCLGRAPGARDEESKSALDLRNELAQPILDVYAAIRTAPVPVLAIVQGRANGFGCALVAQCDLAIASTDAVFSLPEMDHNLPPTLAMSALLHKVPSKRMLHMVYTREPISAVDALAIGIVSRVVPLTDLDLVAEELIAKLTGRNRAAICAIKEYALAAPHADANGAAQLAANLLATVLSSSPAQ